MNSANAEIKMYGLVRGPDGRPKIDGNPRLLHPSIIAAMTKTEFADACAAWEKNNG